MSQPSNDQNRLQPGPLAAVHGVEAPQTAAGRTSSEPCQISMFCRVRKQDKNIQNITKRKVLTFYRLSCQRVHARSCLSMAINDWVFNDVWRIIAQDVSRAVNLAAWPRMFGVHQFIISRYFKNGSPSFGWPAPPKSPKRQLKQRMFCSSNRFCSEKIKDPVELQVWLCELSFNLIQLHC